MNRFLSILAKAHREEKGAEGLEKLLIIGAVVLPLLGLLIFFRKDLSEWLSGEWGDVKDDTTGGFSDAANNGF